MNEIVRTYKQTASMAETSRVTGWSHSKVRKTLVEYGLFESDMYVKICSLYNKGLSAQEIANTLKIASSTVNTYIPYQKCPYNSEYPSKNALNIRRCRENKLNVI